MHFGGMYAYIINNFFRRQTLSQRAASAGDSSIPGWDVFDYSSAWDKSDQCRKIWKSPASPVVIQALIFCQQLSNYSMFACSSKI